ncbi:MAG: SRPBCC family protein [Actinomycetes bacterium]
MSVRLQASVPSAASPAAVWSVLTDWAGQSRWIPLTTVRVTHGPEQGVGARVEALSGFWLGRRPVGLLDRFVVTGWTPPGAQAGELEVLHLGPYFTGEGVFRVTPTSIGTTITATELFALPGGPLTETPARLALPALRRGFAASLRKLASLSEAA